MLPTSAATSVAMRFLLRYSRIVKISLKNKKKSELSANSADYSLFFCIFALKLIIGFKV
jgi:cellobiose phosphorylase